MKNFTLLKVILLKLIFLGQTAGIPANEDSATLSHLTADEKQLITRIVETNKSNREKIETFDCLFERKTTSQGILRSYSGRYAHKNDKVYHKTSFLDKGNDIVQIESEGKIWAIEGLTPPRKFIRCEKITPGEPLRVVAVSPWHKMDGDIGSNLPRYSSQYDRITSIKREEFNNSKIISVEIHQRLTSDPPGTYTSKLICHFSEAKNCLPVRIESFKINNGTGSAPQYIKEITKIISRKVEGQTIYIPAEYHDVFYRDQQKVRETKYRVLEDSIKINQVLSDNLFTVSISPGDRFYDKDRELQWWIPAEGVLGKPAPDFTLNKLEGGKITLSKIQEDVIVIDFWATWCIPCQKMLSILNSIHNWTKENNMPVAFYTISNEKVEVVSSFKKEHKSNIPILLDTEDRPTFKAYQGQGIPYIVIISKGVIQNVFSGSGERSVLEQNLKDMIISALKKETSDI